MSKGKRPHEGQYVNLPYAQLKSKAWRSLSGAAVKVWLELHARFNGGNNGALSLSMAEAAEVLGRWARRPFSARSGSFRELQEKGFIALEEEGSWYHRRAHEWRLTTKPVQSSKGKSPPTMDWRNWQPIKKTERGSSSEPSKSNVVPYQNLKAVVGSK